MYDHLCALGTKGKPFSRFFLRERVKTGLCFLEFKSTYQVIVLFGRFGILVKMENGIVQQIGR